MIVAPKGGALKRFIRKLRWRLLWVFTAFGLGGGLTWHFREPVFDFLLAPSNGTLSPFDGLPIFTGPTEMFSLTIGVAMKGGMAAAFPVATFSIANLLSPLLTRKQRRFIYWFFLPAVFLCFIGGAAFAYYVMLPTGLRFLLNFGEGIAVPLISITEYMSLVTAMLFWLGIIFNVPVVMYMLAKFRIMSHKRFVRFQRYVPVAAFVLSALITPTFDIVNQTLVAVPIILLFEFGLFLAWLARPKPKPTERWHRRWRRRTWGCIKSLWGGE